jgi:glycine/D-amino acid oxidase-like deaminating enzyme
VAYDVAIIGGGIMGTAAAAYLAEAGQSVVLFEESELGAGASGRNSGVLQHPFDALLAELHQESLSLYAELAAIEPRFRLARSAAGILSVAFDEAALAATGEVMRHEFPELEPELLAAEEARALEPALADGVAALRLATGYPVVPAAATLAFGRRAARSGAELRVGVGAKPWIAEEAVRGVALATGETVAAGSVLVTAGPWSADLLEGWRARPPIRRTWGVVVSARLRRAPRHVVEEHGIDVSGSTAPTTFSLVTAEGISSIGSTFFVDEPDATEWPDRLLEAGARYVPALAGATRLGVRACARPVSFDHRPLIGPLPVRGLFVCAGHGPWGMSTGPASAQIVAGAMLADDGSDAIPDELLAGRWPWQADGANA